MSVAQHRRDLERQVADMARKHTQRLEQQRLELQRRMEADRERSQREFDGQQKHLARVQAERERQMNLEVAVAQIEMEEAKKKLKNELFTEKVRRINDLVIAEVKTKLQERSQNQQIEGMKNRIDKSDYESHHPCPAYLKAWLGEHSKAFTIQVLGCRGVGKSTFVNKTLKALDIKDRAATGSSETTVKTEFFDITKHVDLTGCEDIEEVFLVDQPGIGGLEITENEYLGKFGPGHFDYTFILGDKGINELDMALLKHLTFNKKPVSIVRTQCDKSIIGIIDEDEEISEEDAFVQLKEEFGNYVKTEVIDTPDSNLTDLNTYYVGLPHRDYADFQLLVAMLKESKFLTCK